MASSDEHSATPKRPSESENADKINSNDGSSTPEITNETAGQLEQLLALLTGSSLSEEEERAATSNQTTVENLEPPANGNTSSKKGEVIPVELVEDSEPPANGNTSSKKGEVIPVELVEDSEPPTNGNAPSEKSEVIPVELVEDLEPPTNGNTPSEKSEVIPVEAIEDSEPLANESTPNSENEVVNLLSLLEHSTPPSHSEEEEDPSIHHHPEEEQTNFSVSYQQEKKPAESNSSSALVPRETTELQPTPSDDSLTMLQSLLLGPEVLGTEERVIELKEKLARLEKLISDPGELIELLLPVVAELLDRKVKLSNQEMCHALFPLIDKMIFERAKQDRIAMSSALAELIPLAIAQEIREAPDEVVRAIAPAMAPAIQEQIRLDRDSISQALAPEMGRAIKRQIELERDSMVDALYPVIGKTVARYLAEALQTINDKIANTMSADGVRRKIQAKIQGVSEAELILREAIPFRVQAAFLIQKTSGLLIAEAQQSGDRSLESDMIAGMLTAIRSFVNDCISQSGSIAELDEIEYGDSKILLEVAGYCYLAVVIQGDSPSNFVERVRETLSTLLQEYGDSIEQFDGDPETIPDGVLSLINQLVKEDEVLLEQSQSRSTPWALLGVTFILLSAIAVPWGIHQHRQKLYRRLETQTLSALTATPELSVYNFKATADKERLVLEGRVPNTLLRDRAGEIALALAPDRQVDNQIIAVNLPPDPIQAAAEVKRIATLLNREPGMNITARYQTFRPAPSLPLTGKVIVTGMVSRLAQTQQISQAFEEIPGVHSVSNTVDIEAPIVKTRIYFREGNAQIEPIDERGKISLLAKQLRQYPDINLKIVGHSPPSEQEGTKQLALQRAEAAQTALQNSGIDPTRLTVEGLTAAPSDVAKTAPDWMGRCVRFEAIVPTITPNTNN
ncbi:BON domain-containing protein [Lusitaniella coriacea LEGE 07157]|uniref:BON domain-containing protein n=1 Tax=Lusitaniella coriacea LEGE 07157 TaxID=945747 RepID=A0A8J7E0H1_9CYAN|nr:BON domain-containing protein [Lusitaniella coriacea]MBE9118838.1 BON domain-containing protein [Lusitaniella coriacea LEGE 07157]